MSDPEAASHHRLSTGSAELDAILHGGFGESTINIVMGLPGTGKTILVEKLVFANAGDDRPCLYLSTVSEPLDKLVRFLQGFEFYDPELINAQVIYDDLGTELAESGPTALPGRLGELIKRHRPKIVVIDSFKAIRDLGESPVEMRRMVHQLAGLLTAYQVTAFLVGEYETDDIPGFPEFAVADGIVELLRELAGDRDKRYLRVLKLRGSPYQEGLHGFDITSAGLHVFPRLVTPRKPAVHMPDLERIPTGVPGLDAMLDGGFWRGTATLVAGPAGAGKTTFGVQFLIEGVAHGEPGLLLHFQESPAQMDRLLANLNRGTSDLADRGFHRLYHSPVEMRIDRVFLNALELIEAHGVRRVVVDSLGDLSQAAPGAQRLQDYLYSLVQRLAGRGITLVFTLEIATAALGRGVTLPGLFSPFADNIIHLDLGVNEEVYRRIRVVKTRSSGHDSTVRDLRIDGDGVAVV